MMTSFLRDSSLIAATLATWLPFISFVFIIVFARDRLRLSAGLAIGSVACSLVAAAYLLLRHWGAGEPIHYSSRWLIAGDVHVPFGFLLAPLSLLVSESSSNLLRLRQNLASGRMTQGGAGQAAVRLVLENGAPYPHEGSLKFSDVTVQPGTASVTLRSVFPNPELLLLPGMFVRAVVQEGVNETGILLPQRGVPRNSRAQNSASDDEHVEGLLGQGGELA